MSVKREIAALERRMFCDEFHAYLHACHAGKETRDDEEKIALEYQAARDFLAEKASHEEKKYLSKWEALTDQCMAYAGVYAFQCGLYAAFAQLHRPDLLEKASFEHLVMGGLFTSPGSGSHPQYLDWIKQSLALSKKLWKKKETCWADHVTSIGTYWEQQICRAAMNAFYLAYRYGIKIIRDVKPNQAACMTERILLTEYALGITLPMSLREKDQVG